MMEYSGAKPNHILKCTQPIMDDILAGIKKFDVRKNDRNYRVGDIIRFREWSDEKGFCLFATRRITYILTEQASHGGLNRGYVVLGLGEFPGGE